MIEHDTMVYENDPFEKENLQSMAFYVKLIEEYRCDNDNFLELGIGGGKTLELLVNIFKKLTVLDGEVKFIEKYKKRYKEINFIHSYFEDYSVDAETLSNIGMGFILEHVHDPKLVLLKYSKLLSENGRIFVSVPNAASFHRLLANKAGLLHDLNKMSKTDARYGHLRFYDHDEWLDLFETCGLRVIKSHGLFFKPFTTQQIEQLELDDRIFKSLSEMAKDLPSISNSCFFVLEKKRSL